MRGLGWVAFLACVAVLLFLSGPGSAQGSVSEIEAEVVSEPEDLPGTYEVTLTVQTNQSQPACVCSESAVTLSLAPELEWVEASFEPKEYLINWFEKAQRGDVGTHVEEVHLSVLVGEEKTGNDPVVLLVDGVAASNAPQDDRVVPEPLILEVPRGQGGSEDGVRPAGGSGSGEDDARIKEAAIVPAALLAGSVLTLGVVGMRGRMGSR